MKPPHCLVHCKTAPISPGDANLREGFLPLRSGQAKTPASPKCFSLCPIGAIIRPMNSFLLLAGFLAAAAFPLLAAENPAPIRIGMIGLDTSHAPAFAKIFNAAEPKPEFAGMRVVAAFPGGTDLPASRDRVKGFTDQIRAMGIEIVESIPALLPKVDVVLLESVDGRIHLQEARPVLEAGKPVFIDKPLAGSLAEAVAIADLARRRGVPWFSSSSLRYYASVQTLKTDSALGEIVGAHTWGTCTYQEDTPDMFFYGIHGIEMLYALMGPGCEAVARLQTDDADLLSGQWKGGRAGSFRGIRRHKSEFGAVAFGAKGIAAAGKGGGYEELCREIAGFFRSRKPPVSAEETLEIFAFMEAADESKRRGGVPVRLEEVMAKARAQAKTLVE